LAYIRSGMIVPLLADSEQRSQLIPDVITLGELGVAATTRARSSDIGAAATPRRSSSGAQR